MTQEEARRIQKPVPGYPLTMVSDELKLLPSTARFAGTLITCAI